MLNKRLIAATAVMVVLATGCSSLPVIGGLFGNDVPSTGAATGDTTTATSAGTVDVANRPAAPQPTPTAIPTEARAQFDEDEMVLVNLYERVNPAVVSIQNEQTTRSGVDQAAGQGSGFVISADGYIVTNNHVVEDADGVKVVFADGSFETAEIVGTDRYSDLALLKVNKTDLPFVELADSDQAKVGQRVIAIGNPFGLDGTMTLGIISAKGRSLPEAARDGGNFSNPDIIQTDAAINPGNSGGPLLDSKGRVVGVNTAIRTSNDNGAGQPSNSGIGFVVPSNTVKRVVEALREEGRVRYPYLGIQGNIPLSMAANSAELPVKVGVMAAGVVQGGPVARAGLRPAEANTRTGAVSRVGDIIVAFNGRPVKDYDSLIAMLVSSSKPGDTITLRVWRDDKEVDLQVQLAERPN
jgi:2-alkenal reductase